MALLAHFYKGEEKTAFVLAVINFSRRHRSAPTSSDNINESESPSDEVTTHNSKLINANAPQGASESPKGTDVNTEPFFPESATLDWEDVDPPRPHALSVSSHRASGPGEVYDSD